MAKPSRGNTPKMEVHPDAWERFKRAVRPILFLLLSAAQAHAAESSLSGTIARAPYVPSPSTLPSMPTDEWCEVIDAALANPNIGQTRRDEYIATGQRMHCPHQMFVPPPRTTAQQPPATPEQWCAEAFKVLGNPAADPYLKAAILEKARNRGCLR
jgi:hypothetical protein